jgi:hypothetical protein
MSNHAKQLYDVFDSIAADKTLTLKRGVSGFKNDAARREYLLNTIEQSASTWSGGALSTSNIIETIQRAVAIELLSIMNDDPNVVKLWEKV